MLLSFNYWKLANYLAGYGLLSLYGLCSLTQLLSTFGIAAELNIIVWWFGLGLLGFLLVTVAAVLEFIAYNECYVLSIQGVKAAEKV